MGLWFKVSLAVLLSLLWSLPVFYGYRDTPADNEMSPQFLGWIRSDDFHRYGSFIDQTRYQNRLIYMDYSAVEPQSPRMIAAYFSVLGLVGKALPLPAQTLWLFSSWVISFVFVFALSSVLVKWASNSRQVCFAMLLIMFSGGLEVLAHSLGMAIPREKNFWMDGFSTFCTFHNPLKIAGITCVLSMMYFWQLWLEKKRLTHLIIVSALVLFSWAIHPNSAIPGYVALVITVFCASKYMHKPRQWQMFFSVYSPLLISFTAILLYIIWMRTDVTTANIIKQYHIPWLVEPFRFYPVRYGVMLPLGIVGLCCCIRRCRLTDVMFAGWWLGAELFAHFSNMSGLLFQHMVHLPMAVFAAWTLEKITAVSPKIKWALLAGLFCVFAFQNGYILQKVIRQTRQDVWPTSLYWTMGEIRAAEELRNYPQGNVLVSRNAGNKVAWLALKPVFLGHWGTTPSRHEKEQEIVSFFNPNTSFLWRQELLKRYDIDYIWYGPDEQLSGVIESRSFLEEIIKNKAVTVYRVLRISAVE
jgi:hypothetical protein